MALPGKVRPRAGCIVRDPRDMEPLPSAGRRVPNTSFWRRRLAAGDVEEVTEAAPVRTESEKPDTSSAKSSKAKK